MCEGGADVHTALKCRPVKSAAMSRPFSGDSEKGAAVLSGPRGVVKGRTGRPCGDADRKANRKKGEAFLFEGKMRQKSDVSDIENGKSIRKGAKNPGFASALKPGRIVASCFRKNRTPCLWSRTRIRTSYFSLASDTYFLPSGCRQMNCAFFVNIRCTFALCSKCKGGFRLGEKNRFLRHFPLAIE